MSIFNTIKYVCITTTYFFSAIGVLSAFEVENSLGTWSSPTQIDNTLSSNYQVVMDNSGIATAIWTSDNNQVFYARLPDEGGWQGALPLSKAGDSAANDSLAVDGNGNVMALWHIVANDSTTYQAAYYSNEAQDWVLLPSPLADIPAPKGSLRWISDIVFDTNCNALIAWGFDDKTASSIITVRFDAATQKWQPIDTLSVSFPNMIRLAFDNSGQALMVWMDSDNTTKKFFVNSSQLSNGGTTWSTPIPVSSSNGFNPMLARDSHGNSVVVWLDPSTLKLGAAQLNAGSDQWESIPAPSGGHRAPLGPYGIYTDVSGVTTVFWTEYGQNMAGITLFAASLSPESMQQQWTAPVALFSAKQLEAFCYSKDRSGNAFASWITKGTTPTFQGAVKLVDHDWTAPVEFATAGDGSFVQALSVMGTSVILYVDNGTTQAITGTGLFDTKFMINKKEIRLNSK